MTNSERSQTSGMSAGSKFFWLTKYEVETGSDLESSDATGSMRNFPTAFLPMEELEESSSGD